MAFSATEVQAIAKAFGSTPTLVAAHIATLTLTPALESDVRGELTNYTAGFANVGVEIEPKESNFGARIDFGSQSTTIQHNLASLLEWPYPLFNPLAAQMGTIQISN